MNWLDYILVFVFLLNLYNGFRSGFLRQVSGLVSILIAFYFALFWSDTAKTYLQNIFKFEKITSMPAQNGGASAWLVGNILDIIAFLLVFLLIVVVLALISRKLRFLNKVPLVGPLNALTGGVLGALKGMIIVFLIVALLSLIRTDFWSNTVEASVIVPLSRHYLPLFFGLIFDYVTTKLGRFA